MRRALHKRDLLDFRVQQARRFAVGLAAQVVHCNVVGAGVGFVLASRHIGKRFQCADGALRRKADAGCVQERHGFQNRPFFLANLFPIDAHTVQSLSIFNRFDGIVGVTL
ncbi:hypothetical protein SDC9_69045 [bioreactor metagenome]|uniref:Uncharacterized protein n=1 Tax=bioreactor metagenome TaxID=1076179 RepID=A0A644Y3M7_9ZZZZ